MIAIELFASIYIIIIGIAMLSMWIFLLGKREVPELTTKPTQIYFHLVAELMTSIALIIGGVGYIMNQSWGVALFYRYGNLFYYKCCRFLWSIKRLANVYYFNCVYYYFSDFCNIDYSC
jgi:hypothetical protein